MHMRLLLVDFAAVSAIALLQFHCYAGDDGLKDKIVRATLNHSEPAVVKVGINGVTSLEFPYKIEAIDGYGFSQAPGSEDTFQISYTKGSNYFSVRALKPGVTGNLTVVLDQKVYSLFFEESNDPSFVNIFTAATSNGSAAPGERKAVQEGKVAPPAQLGALLEKVKGYALLKATSPEMLDGLQVAEPGKTIKVSDHVELTIRRVLKDDSLGAVAFEVGIDNRSGSDFAYDPQGLQVRAKDQVYSAVMEDASGIVKAGTTTSIFFLVNDPRLLQSSGWPASNDFDLVLQRSTESNAEGLTFSQPPGDYLPTATTIQQAGRDPDPPFAPGQGTDQPLNPAPSPAKHASPKKVAKQLASGKKADSKPEKSPKESVAKTQKPPAKRLFGWL
jgi:hypothetical protein